ncbi:MAG: TolB family protein [bacterium]
MHDRIHFQSYSFDGSKIAFLVHDSDLDLSQGPVSRLYISNSDYSEHICIDEGIFYYDVAWKNDSDGLIYSKNHDLWEYSISENEKTQLSTTPEHEENPSYSSDGRYIAFSVQNAAFQDAVYITQAHSFQPIKLMDEARLARWVPNRNLLMIARERTLDNERSWTESWLIDLEGNIVRKFAEGTYTQLDFAPDGRHFVYTLHGDLWLDRIP